MNLATFRMSSGQQEAVKLAAVVLMVVDHVGIVFLDGGAYMLARALGRFAFPLFAFLIAYNVQRRGVHVDRYVLPMVVLLLVSQLPHAVSVGSGAVNIFAVLLAGTLLLELDVRPVRLALVVGLVAVAGAFGEYGIVGVLLIPAIGWALRSGSIASIGTVAALLLATNLGSGLELATFGAPLVVALIVQSRTELDRLPRWLWNGFYPAHLAALAVAATLLPHGSL